MKRDEKQMCVGDIVKYALEDCKAFGIVLELGPVSYYGSKTTSTRFKVFWYSVINWKVDRYGKIPGWFDFSSHMWEYTEVIWTPDTHTT